MCVVLPPKIIPQLPLTAVSSFTHTHVVIAVCVVPPCVLSRRVCGPASKDYPSASFDRRVFLYPHTRRDRRVCRPAMCVVPPCVLSRRVCCPASKDYPSDSFDRRVFLLPTHTS